MIAMNTVPFSLYSILAHQFRLANFPFLEKGLCGCALNHRFKAKTESKINERVNNSITFNSSGGGIFIKDGKIIGRICEKNEIPTYTRDVHNADIRYFIRSFCICSYKTVTV